MYKCIVVCLFVMTTGLIELSGQEYSLYINLNEYYPLGKANKSGYPILWYSSEKEKVLVGGFGFGFKMKYRIKEQMAVTGKGSLIRYRQYDEPILLVDENEGLLGIKNGVITEYGVGLQGGITYELSKMVDIGTGIGIITMVSSKTNFGKGITEEKKLKIKNGYYHPILITIPFELTFNFNRINITPRYEIGLLNRLRGDTNGKEYGNIVSMEIGYLLNKNKSESK